MNALWRILFRLDRTFSWVRYHTKRKFTRAGLFVLVASIIGAGMGLDMDSTVAYQIFTVSCSLMLASICFGWLFRGRFSAIRKLPRFGTAGKPFEYQITITNHTLELQTGLSLIEDLEDTRLAFAEWKARQLAEQKSVKSLRFSQRQNPVPSRPARIKEAPVPTIAPNGKAEVTLEVLPLRRGILRFRGITLARPDPLGLFRALGKIKLPDSTLILPKRYALPPIALPGVMKYQEGGVTLASNVGQSEEFVALRDYRRGDPLRHIHWKSWAKAGKPIVKEFSDEFFVRHALVLDTFSDNPVSYVFEEAVSVAASFAYTIQTQESLLDLLFVGADAYCFTAGRGLAHADQMLEILASVKVCTGKSFATLESLVLNHASSVSGCICVLLAWDEARRNFVKKLRGLGVPVLVVVILQNEPKEPLDRGPMQDEPENFYTLILGKIEEGLAKL